MEVAAVDVGAGSLLRRLGLRRLGDRIKPFIVDWTELHRTSHRGHTVQLATATTAYTGSTHPSCRISARLSADKAVDMVRAAHPAHGAAALHWLQSFIVGPALLAGLSDTAKPQDQQSTGHRGARRADRLYLHPQLRRAPTGRDLRPRTDPPFSRWRLPKFADKLNEKGWLMDSFGMGVDLVPRRKEAVMHAAVGDRIIVASAT